MKANLTWDDIGKLYKGKYLNFEEDILYGYYIITNNESLKLGRIEKVRVGAWMHWCLFLNEDSYLSPGCNDEVREMQRLLGSQSYKEKYKSSKESENNTSI